MKEVTDPRLLAQLNAPTAAKKAPPRQYSAEAAKAALIKSDVVMNEGMKKLSAPQRKKALANYYASPTVRKLRENAGLPAVRTREEQVQTLGRTAVSQRKKLTEGGIYDIPVVGTALKKLDDVTAASQAGFSEALFGIPERLAAGVDAAAGNNPGAKNYRENLTIRRATNEADKDRSTLGNVVGQIMGAVGGGVGAAGVVRKGGEQVARVAPRAGNFIQNLTRLETGRRGANAAKIVAGGAAGGAAQAAGEGTDVGTGAAVGAIAAPLVVGGFKAGEWATRPVRDFFRMSSAKGILGRVTKMTMEEAQAAAAQFRRDTGAEPTLFEILPPGDRQAAQKLLKKMPDASRERVTAAVRGRVRNMPGELSRRTQEVTEPQQRATAQRLARELAESRAPGAAPTQAEIDLARQAVTNPSRMEEVRNTMNGNIMRPFDDAPVVNGVNDLVPTAPQNQNGNIVYVETDPDISSMIRRAAGTLRLQNGPITGANMTNLRAALQEIVKRGGNEGLIARSAVTHLDDVLAREAPDVADAAARMRDANVANKTRMQAESEGRKTRTQEEVPVDSRLSGYRSDTAYTTPEGAAGRAIGQRASLIRDFGQKPEAAISRANEIAESPNAQQAIGNNLGAAEGAAISRAAETQAESLRRLGTLRQPVKGEEGDMDFGDLAMSMSLLSPTALIRTKSQAVGMIMRLASGIPEGRANQIADALFSQNPAQMSNAVRLLTSAGEQGARALRDIVAAVGIGSQSGGLNGEDAPQGAAPAAALTGEAQAAELPTEPGEVTDPELLAELESSAAQDVPYGRSVIEALFPDAEITEDVRDPNSELGRKNPGSYHNSTDGAVDLRPIPGVTFEEFIETLETEGYDIVEAIDEVNNPSGHATGPHWHVVFA
jgi:hypothetical protein